MIVQVSDEAGVDGEAHVLDVLAQIGNTYQVEAGEFSITGELVAAVPHGDPDGMLVDLVLHEWRPGQSLPDEEPVTVAISPGWLTLTYL